MRIDPFAQARRLLEQIDRDFLPDLATEPTVAIAALFDGLVVTTRAPSRPGRGCAVDGTYDPGPPPRILVANDVSPSRQRFTALHELGHHLIEHDDHLNDLDVPDSERRDEEICNEIAATILLPDDMVEETIPAGRFTAEDVARLHGASGSASRAACCVAAVRRLHRPGCVILGLADGTADFIAHQHATPWRIARGTPQGAASLLARAARVGRARDVTQVRFANGNSSSKVHADAFAAPDSWIYMVVVADTHSPWASKLNFGISDAGAPSEVVECPFCDHAFTAWWPRCRTCGDYKCPQCRRCSCDVAYGTVKRCTGCDLMKASHLFPGGGTVCVDCL